MKIAFVIINLLFIVLNINAQSIPTASFTTDNTKCTNVPIIFLDQSSNTPTSWTWTFTAGSPSVSTAQFPSITYTNAGTYMVRLVSTNTVGASVAYTANIVVSSNPTVTVVSPTVCNGYITTLAASGASSYTWIPGNVTGSTFTTIANSSTNYIVTGSLPSGCKNSKTTTLAVLPSPSITTNSAAICSGNNAVLIANGGVTYTWSTNATAPSTSVSPNLTTSYTVASTGSNNCVGYAITTVTVNPLPFINATSAVVCYGETTTLTATGANTYTWNNGQTGSNMIDSPIATSNYSVTGTSLLGCNKTVTTSITVGSMPSISVNSPTICLGSAAHLIASGVNSYTWNTGINTQTITLTPTATTIYTVSGNLTGCNGIVSKTTTVVVNPLPTIQTTSSSICSGFQTTLTATGANTYQWLPSSYQGANYIVAPSVNTTYTVIGTSILGCSSTTLAHVVVYSNPSITANTTLNSFCAGTQTVTLIANGASTYTWSNLQVGFSIFVSPTTSQTYTVIGQNSNNCSDTATVSIIVHPIPNVTLGVLPNPICVNHTEIQLIGTPTSGVFSGTGVFGAAFYPTISGVGSFSVHYTYTDINNCSATSSQIVTVYACTGIEEQQQIEELILFPVPTNGYINIQNKNSSEYDMFIYNSVGELIFTEKLKETEVKFNLSNFTNGVYTVFFRDSNNRVIAKKIIKCN